MQRVAENRISELRKRLDALNFIVIDHRELTERLIAIRFGRIRPVGSGRKASFVWTSDDGIQIRVHDVVAVEHLEDRLASFGMAHRIHRIVIEIG